ncbi:MAG: ammonia-forming cytochrome c nitrite reductase subunit c552 [Proteobacteria bacterium]|nr:ammonia-forming cytochrome c nitrite reductase subunit c552 [Pseudomonadota bacterium]
MNCHRGRYDVSKKVTTTAPYYGFSDRFYNHYSPQADMLFGKNGYEYNGLVIGPSSVHLLYTQNSCVSCHMQKRTNGSSVHSNHEMRMDSLGVTDWVGVCQGCHSEITTSFEDKLANADYDNDGTVEAFTVEVEGLLETLKANLPLDSETGEPVNMAKDTLAVKDRPDLVQGIWNYYFVKDEASHGIHNPAYTVALLRSAIYVITGVEYVDETVPTEFALEQNYPNPFNPTTEIRFAVAKAGPVLLEIYDLTGRVVATLVNQDLPAGTHRVVWNAKNNRGESLSSGVYLYRISSSDFVSTKKMVLLK